MKFYEDIPVGEEWQLGAHTFKADEIKRFAAAYDPQPFHTDEAEAERSHFGALCASGWHTLAVWMQLHVREMQRRTRDFELAGIPVAKVGAARRMEALKWLKPVYAGDTLTFVSEVVDKQDDAERPGWGLVAFRITGRNQKGEDAIAFTIHLPVEGHAASADSAPSR